MQHADIHKKNIDRTVSQVVVITAVPTARDLNINVLIYARSGTDR